MTNKLLRYLAIGSIVLTVVQKAGAEEMNASTGNKTSQSNMQFGGEVQKQLDTEERSLSLMREIRLKRSRDTWDQVAPSIAKVEQSVQRAESDKPGSIESSGLRFQLAMAYFKMGMEDKARPLLEGCISTFKPYLQSHPMPPTDKSDDKLREANSLSSTFLGQMYVNQHRYSDAKKVVEQALPFQENRAVQDHSENATLSLSYMVMAIATGKQGDYAKAREYLVKMNKANELAKQVSK